MGYRSAPVERQRGERGCQRIPAKLRSTTVISPGLRLRMGAHCQSIPGNRLDLSCAPMHHKMRSGEGGAQIADQIRPLPREAAVGVRRAAEVAIGRGPSRARSGVSMAYDAIPARTFNPALLLLLTTALPS